MMSDKRKLLIFTYYFPPCAAVATHRILGFARHLPNYGWDVDVIAPPNVKWEPTDENLMRQVSPSTTVERVPFPSGFVSRQFGRLMPYDVWLPAATNRGRRYISQTKPDCVLTTGPPDCVHLLGYAMKSKFGVPWVADLRDPFAAPSDWHRSLTPRLMTEWLAARLAMRNADHIAVNTPSYHRMLIDLHPEHREKMSVLTNGYDYDTLRTSHTRGVGMTSVQMLHVGEVYNGRDPRPLFASLKRLRDSQSVPVGGIKLSLIGRWNHAEINLPAAVLASGIGEMAEMHGQLAHQEALAAMKQAGILVVLQSKNSSAVPAKLYEYLSIGCPILAIADPASDIAGVLHHSGVTHRIVAPDDANGLDAAILDLRQRVLDGQYTAADPDKLAAFSRSDVARRLALQLDDLAAKQPVSRPSSRHVSQGP